MSEVKNPIEKLREDVLNALGFSSGLRVRFTTSETKAADKQHKKERAAAIRVLDDFAAQWEAKEVLGFGTSDGWYRWDTRLKAPAKDEVRTTILVPRQPEPPAERNELLEAAEAVEAWCRCTNHWRGMPAELHLKCDVLASAIRTERNR